MRRALLAILAVACGGEDGGVTPGCDDGDVGLNVLYEIQASAACEPFTPDTVEVTVSNGNDVQVLTAADAIETGDGFLKLPWSTDLTDGEQATADLFLRGSGVAAIETRTFTVDRDGCVDVSFTPACEIFAP